MQIARSLNLSVKTIESHRENIKRKLGAKSSRELVDRYQIRGGNVSAAKKGLPLLKR